MIYARLFVTFLKIGLFTVGSGYSMLVLAQRYVVEHYHWLTMQEFTDLVAVAEVTPGPFIFNLATFVGTRLGGVTGAIMANIGLLAVPFLALYLIALNYPALKDRPIARKLLAVFRPMAIGFITVAILNLFRISIPDVKSAAIAVAVVLLTYAAGVSPIIIVLLGVALALLMK